MRVALCFAGCLERPCLRTPREGLGTPSPGSRTQTALDVAQCPLKLESALLEPTGLDLHPVQPHATGPGLYWGLSLIGWGHTDYQGSSSLPGVL